jgi:hypothetical protein
MGEGRSSVSRSPAATHRLVAPETKKKKQERTSFAIGTYLAASTSTSSLHTVATLTGTCVAINTDKLETNV